MNDAVWLGAILLLTAPGMVICRVPQIARMPLTARLGFAFATGIFIATALMYVDALCGIHWTRANLFVPLGLISFLGVVEDRLPRLSGQPRAAVLHLILPWIFLLLTLYAIADARATCGDIVFIWAPKAQAFAEARTIDLKFLGFPHYYLMHPDYPPLVPLTYTFGSIAAHQLSWWGALFLSFFILLAMIAIIRNPLFTAIMCFVFVSAYLPGGADPFLILFECIAIAALTFHDDMHWIAAFALAAAAFSKVEGLSFAIIVAIAYAMTHRKARRAAALLLPPAVLIGSWLIFMGRHRLLDQYARGSSPMYWHLFRADLRLVWRFASFRGYWLPWVASIVPLFTARLTRTIAFPLLVAGGSCAATMFFYLHNPDPAYWIASSADRILVTPLMCVAIASAAAWRNIEQPDRFADAPIGQTV